MCRNIRAHFKLRVITVIIYGLLFVHIYIYIYSYEFSSGSIILNYKEIYKETDIQKFQES